MARARQSGPTGVGDPTNTSTEISHGVFKAMNLIFCIMVYCHHFDFIIDFHVQPCTVLSFSVGKVKYWP